MTTAMAMPGNLTSLTCRDDARTTGRIGLAHRSSHFLPVLLATLACFVVAALALTWQPSLLPR